MVAVDKVFCFAADLSYMLACICAHILHFSGKGNGILVDSLPLKTIYTVSQKKHSGRF